MAGVSLCSYCKNYTGLKDGWIMTCKAYPEGIPCDFDGSKEACNDGIAFEMKKDATEVAKKICANF